MKEVTIMKRNRLSRFLALTLAVAVFLCACGVNGTGETISPEFPRNVTPMNAAWRAAFGYEIPIESVSHGDDYVIEWQDSGMELAIRHLLGKSEGDILHSDLWDIRILSIGYDPVDGIVRVRAYADTSAPLLDLDYEGEILAEETFDLKEDIPRIASLSDLIHFDSLQELHLTDNTIFQAALQDTHPLSLTGVELAPNLDVLTLTRFELADLDSLSACDGLRVLECSRIPFDDLSFLRSIHSLERLCLTDSGRLDLSPLAGLENLSILRLYGSELVSLEPLTQLPALKALDICADAAYPSLEPLTRTSIEYLDMSCSMNARGEYSDLYADLDYDSLTKLPNLCWLDLTNHTRVDGDLCAAILAGSPNLKYLRVNYTPAARELPKPDGLEVYENAI